MRTSKLIIFLSLISIFNTSVVSAEALYRVWVKKNFSLPGKGNVEKFEMSFYDASVRTFHYIPNDWKVTIDNWDESDQLNWTGSLVGEAGHYSGSLGLPDFLNIYVLMEAASPKFKVKLKIYIQDPDNDVDKIVELTNDSLEIIPASKIEGGSK